MPHNFEVCVIGGGASGISAAISAARSRKSVVLCDRMPALGKKILASGNGRCNLSNKDLNETFYNQASRDLVKSILKKFGKVEILKFFDSLGLEVYSDAGRVFPVTNQSSSVLKVLEMELGRLSVRTELNFELAGISQKRDGFTVVSKSNKRFECTRVVIACGGRSYPALGSDGSSYELLSELGHKIVEPVPVAVPLMVKDPICHMLQGQKISVTAKAIVDKSVLCESSGDLIFTKYGISGTAILDISEVVSIAIHRHNKKDIAVSIDMMPFVSEDLLIDKLNDRIDRGVAADDLVVGIMPNKFSRPLNDLLNTKNARTIAHGLKFRNFKITGTRGWNEAEFTAGGIDIAEVKESTLESRLCRGLYFSGEILDVNGRRGGYNLAWAWASGYVAGQTG